METIRGKSYLSLGIILLISTTVLYLIQQYNFVLYHSLAEFFSSFIVFAVFMIGWNSRYRIENDYVLFLGIMFVFVGTFSVIHALSFEGMNVFSSFDANLSTQIIIAGRLLEAIAYVLAAFLAGELIFESKIKDISRTQRISLIIVGYSVAVFAILISIFVFDAVPDAYITGEGPTQFKVTVEYLISITFLGAALIVYKIRRSFSKRVFLLLFFSIILAFLSEIPFMYYNHTHDLMNMIGHYLKIVSYSFLYLAIVQTGITQPQNILYKQLQETKEREELLGSLLRHDLLNKLQIISAYQERIEDTLPESSQDDLNRAQRAAEDAENLIEKVQILTSLDSIDMSGEIPLDEILTDAIEQNEDLASDNDISIQYDSINVNVTGTTLLQEAFSNILQNSLLHSQGSHVHIQGMTQDDSVIVSIADDGVGIPDYIVEELFDDGARTSDEPRDIGLLLVQEIISLCDGSIEVSESDQGGTQFDIYLPKA